MFRVHSRWSHLPVIPSKQEKRAIRLTGVNYRIIPVARPDVLDNQSNRGRRLTIAYDSPTTNDYISRISAAPELVKTSPGSSIGFFVANGYIKLERI